MPQSCECRLKSSEPMENEESYLSLIVEEENVINICVELKLSLTDSNTYPTLEKTLHLCMFVHVTYTFLYQRTNFIRHLSLCECRSAYEQFYVACACMCYEFNKREAKCSTIQKWRNSLIMYPFPKHLYFLYSIDNISILTCNTTMTCHSSHMLFLDELLLKNDLS